MAPSDDRSNRSSTDNDNNNDNPFISFKRYADEQISSILQGVLAFPSAFTSTSPHDRWKAFDEEARRRSLERDARLEQQDRESRSGEENPYSAADVSTTPRNAASRGFPSGFLSHFLYGILNHLVDEDDLPAAFPVAYVAWSPYSPLRLEEHGRLSEAGTKWRRAFEDLIAVQNGLEMPSESENSRYHDCSSAEWVRSMLDRGTLGRWKPICQKQMATRQPDNDADEDKEFTELDLYQSFLGAQSSPGTPSPATEHKTEPPSAESVSRLLPDRPSSAINTADILGRAINAARKAVQSDNAGHYDDAYEMYHRSLGHLLSAERRETNDEALKRIRTKISEYTERVSELRVLLDEDDEADEWEPHATGPTGKVPIANTSSSTDNDQVKPSIVSTLTNTERRTLSDGTVHTRIVLKQRFADGNEECSETYLTTRGSDLQDQAQTTQAGGLVEELAKESAQETKQEKSKKGWFWS